jgi:DNA-binding protein H-NS
MSKLVAITAKPKKTRGRKKAASVGTKIAPKCTDPINAGQTWTGRGRTLLWAAELQKTGKLDSARII